MQLSEDDEPPPTPPKKSWISKQNLKAKKKEAAEMRWNERTGPSGLIILIISPLSALKKKKKII